MKKSQVSFVIRTKNEGLWIGKVLRLLQKQTFKNFEIIIVDSGSTDKTLEIIKKFDARFLKIKPKDFNFSYALNLGISKAKGDYIAIISGHSIPISDTWLAGGMENFKDKKMAAVTGYMSAFPLGYLSREWGNIFFASYQRKAKHKCKNMTNTNAIIRKDLWKEYPFDETLLECEDYDWASEMLVRGYNVVKDPKFSVFHSHLMLGRPFGFLRYFRWRRICKKINGRKRLRAGY